MHFVDCGGEPPSLRPLEKYNARGNPVWNPKCRKAEYSAFISDLQSSFKSLCAYCERKCERPEKEDSEKDHGNEVGREPQDQDDDVDQYRGREQDNTVDHFRPRSRFRPRTFEWENLVYACHRCNWKKADQFPNGEEDNHRLDRLENQLAARKNRRADLENQLAALKPGGVVKEPRHLNTVESIEKKEIPSIEKEIKRIKERIEDTKRSDSEIAIFEHRFGRTFVHPSESDGYVNPRDQEERAEKFFAFNAEGEILPAADLPNDEWSKAVRTIADFELNPDDTGRKSLRRLRVAKWNEMKRLMRRNPAFAQRIGELGNTEFPTLVKWVLNHPD